MPIKVKWGSSATADIGGASRGQYRSRDSQASLSLGVWERKQAMQDARYERLSRQMIEQSQRGGLWERQQADFLEAREVGEVEFGRKKELAKTASEADIEAKRVEYEQEKLQRKEEYEYRGRETEQKFGQERETTELAGLDEHQAQIQALGAQQLTPEGRKAWEQLEYWRGNIEANREQLIKSGEYMMYRRNWKRRAEAFKLDALKVPTLQDEFDAGRVIATDPQTGKQYIQGGRGAPRPVPPDPALAKQQADQAATAKKAEADLLKKQEAIKGVAGKWLSSQAITTPTPEEFREAMQYAYDLDQAAAGFQPAQDWASKMPAAPPGLEIPQQPPPGAAPGTAAAPALLAPQQQAPPGAESWGGAQESAANIRATEEAMTGAGAPSWMRQTPTGPAAPPAPQRALGAAPRPGSRAEAVAQRQASAPLEGDPSTPQIEMRTEVEAGVQSGPLSPDGKYQWDGGKWVPR